MDADIAKPVTKSTSIIDVIITSFLVSLLTLLGVNYLYTETEHLNAFKKPSNILVLNYDAVVQNILTKKVDANALKVNEIYEKAVVKLAKNGYIVIDSKNVKSYPSSQAVNTQDLADVILEQLK